MDGDLCGGTADAICDCGGEAGGIVCRAVPALWREPEGWVQMACALPVGQRCRPAGSLAGTAASSACHCGRHRRTLPCGATQAPELGAAEGACLAGASGAGHGLACVE